MDTIDPRLSTTSDGAPGSLFGKTRGAVLALLLLRPDERFHLRQVARLCGTGLGAVQRELAALTRLGILLREASGRQIYFQANRQSPLFNELQGLVIKTSGVVDVLREALGPIKADICVAFIFGSFARQEPRETSDIDLLVVANPKRLTFDRLAAALTPAQSRLGREVNPTFYPPAELRRKSAAGHHFVRSVMQGPKIFLIGDEDELRAAAKARPSQAAHAVTR